MAAANKQYLHPDSRWMLVLLAAMVSLGPLSIDMYLPAMPAMREALDTSVANIQLTLSAYLTGFAVFHLFCGPLADRFGRKPILIGGTAIFIIACIGCSLSTSVEQLIAFRLLQGLGACVGPTLSRAVTRDLFGPRRAAKALSIIAMLMALAPAVAPSLGSAMLIIFPWSSIFVFLAIYGLLMVYLVHYFLPESLPQRQSLHPLSIGRNYRELSVSPSFMVVALGCSLCYAAMMSYLAASGFVYLEMLGVPIQYFGLIFLTTVVGYFIGSASSAKLASHFESDQVVRMGAILAASACLIMLTCSSIWPQSIWALMLPTMIYTASLGMVLPHAMNLALQPYPHMAGTASALFGFIQMGVSAAASGAVGLLLSDSPAPMVWLMSILAGLGLILLLRVRSLDPPQET
ncbi:multidrug effflux MFS transporter [Parahaliea sp. F7430]|uniref:Bcr/CflA family efflux transporter n=1 Tax=Sediminihaliea albiluteola TaxID=2758564 RepID=A0A7W2YJQ4_9GAMM|nr:multidrug effflux MFS transporter [Sediminihaliea albiluteola]MBA6413826.1 multidrug effflux MFS transporter [Sediminihaliea albiluteola]